MFYNTSADFAPINLLDKEYFEPFGKNQVVFELQIGIFVQYLFCQLTGILQQGAIRHQVRYLQIDMLSALACSLQITMATQAQIGFGNFKTVVAAHHDLQSLAGIVAEFMRRDQNAIGLFGSTAYTSPKLM